ncbi:DUF2905 domain-containing protein [Hydrogenimonas cancrithermarum]|uniref:DUF2905 domain-containing protein n=1 Tax=Hydrogenimonas cancrithermarum TaxID=2993563 RepID=A0ABM8FPU6_9BACT|nr:DUF2905 domain-containing protein [Hydrogenimonas cancrithermarum]BDY13855.1 hypothetical protein HCR_21670 [Hydrogenimonas cancrithermarum]
MHDAGRYIIGLGIVLILFGLFVTVVGKLPGDIVVRRENFTFYFPITTSILFSILLSLMFYLFSKFF